MEITTTNTPKPYENRVWIARDPKSDTTKEGFAMTSSMKEEEEAVTGTVLHAGPECKSAKPGARIVFGLNTGVDFILNGNPITILREVQIYGEI